MAYFYVPANALNNKDLRASWDCLKPLREKGQEVGIMLVALKGWLGFSKEQREVQYENFLKLTKESGPLRAIVMAPNLPWQETDWYHATPSALAKIKLTIDFAAALPHCHNNPLVTFHLNTLFTAGQWRELGKSSVEIVNNAEIIFQKIIAPALAAAAAYASQEGVELRIETTPIPEFGDRSEPELNTLGNPFPLYSGRGIREIRASGLGIALDLCHTHTLFKISAFYHAFGERLFDMYHGIFSQDIPYLSGRNLLDEVKKLNSGDVVHLNDSRNYFDPERQMLHEEGVTLGLGEIAELPDIIKALVNRDIHTVFEINEQDYVTRPNLKKSMEYLLSYV